MRQENIRRLISIGLLSVLLTVFGLTTDSFFTSVNLLNILRESSVVGIMAIGVTFVIITAGIDLSTGAIVGMSAMICANLLYHYHLPAGLIMLIAILIGTAAGFLNGLLVTLLRLPDFIATLSTQFIFQSLVLVFAIRENGSIVGKVIENRTILLMGGSINGVYLVSMAFIVLATAGQIILKKTKLGTYIYAVGANRKSADLSGVPVNKIKMAVFGITGFLCGIAALFTMGRVGSVSTDMGSGMEFDVISAVVVGGCAFNGGRGDVIGSVVGALFMAVLQNGILKYNFPTAIQLVVKGVVIIFMVVFDSIYNSYMEKRIITKARQQEELAGGKM